MKTRKTILFNLVLGKPPKIQKLNTMDIRIVVKTHSWRKTPFKSFLQKPSHWPDGPTNRTPLSIKLYFSPTNIYKGYPAILKRSAGGRIVAEHFYKLTNPTVAKKDLQNCSARLKKNYRNKNISTFCFKQDRTCWDVQPELPA